MLMTKTPSEHIFSIESVRTLEAEIANKNTEQLRVKDEECR